MTCVTSVHTVSVRTIKLYVSNQRGLGATILSSSGSNENQKCSGNSTKVTRGKGHEARKPAPGCQHSRKKTPHFVPSSETGPPSSFAIKFEARRGPVMILVGGSQEGVVA